MLIKIAYCFYRNKHNYVNALGEGVAGSVMAESYWRTFRRLDMLGSQVYYHFNVKIQVNMPPVEAFECKV
jgi:hypothetical protein